MHPIEPFARRAFAAGWASTSGPMTDRVKTAAAVAVRLAAEHADDPRILEVTLHLGRLEGLWARFFARRDELTHRHATTLRGLWRQALTREVLAHAVRAARERPVGEADTSTDDTRRQLAAATAAVAGALAALPQRPEWTSLRRALRDALAAGRAEGQAGAAAISTGDDSGWDAAFQDAYDALEADHALWDEADLWLRRLLDRAQAQLGRALAAARAAGATDDGQVDALNDATDQGDAPGFTADWALGTALAAGMLAYYQAQGLLLLDWTTAGDGRVCATCQDNEDNSPYPAEEFPAMPAHPRCRCVATAAS